MFTFAGVVATVILRPPELYNAVWVWRNEFHTVEEPEALARE